MGFIRTTAPSRDWPARQRDTIGLASLVVLAFDQEAAIGQDFDTVLRGQAWAAEQRK